MASDGIAFRPTSAHDEAATLFGRTVALVALTAGASALGAYLGRNVAYLWEWLFHRLPGVSDRPEPRGDLVERFIHIRYLDVRPNSAFTDDRHIGYEVADDVAGPVLQAGVVTVGVGPPAEGGLVEGRQTARLLGKNPEVGDTANAEDSWLVLDARRHATTIEATALSRKPMRCGYHVGDPNDFQHQEHRESVAFVGR